MIELYKNGAYLIDGVKLFPDTPETEKNINVDYSQ